MTVPRVVAYVPDLMDRSRLAGVDGLVFVSSPAALAEAATGAEVVVVDLARPGVLEALAGLADLGGVRTIGFGSHVDHELLASAAAAGCQKVLPRSRFFASVAELLG
ncbi:MAG: hypothetical protein ACRD1K_17280 [Acidimicrobiales bacterium]